MRMEGKNIALRAGWKGLLDFRSLTLDVRSHPDILLPCGRWEECASRRNFTNPHKLYKSFLKMT